MITLDFAGLQTERCKGVDNAGKEGSDYELWSPHDDGRHGSNKECFLGHEVTYIRRKQNSECFNGEDLERQTMRVPCACTMADYQCDMDYYMSKAGKCEKIKDSKLGESIESKDCSLTGFYFESQGYRKIPGNYCQGGIQMDPVKRYCSRYGYATNAISPKQLAMAAILIACLYYGWPLIEAIILILPIPDPKGSVDAIKNVGNQGIDLVSGVMTSSSSQRMAAAAGNQGYGQNLEAAPDAFMEDDDSGDDIGNKPSGLNYDSDEHNDEENIAIAGQSSELIDLGGSSSGSTTTDGSRRAANIPKLSGPR